ncbi:unnamed protein product [Closterium sp. NIES-54]
MRGTTRLGLLSLSRFRHPHSPDAHVTLSIPSLTHSRSAVTPVAPSLPSLLHSHLARTSVALSLPSPFPTRCSPFPAAAPPSLRGAPLSLCTVPPSLRAAPPSLRVTHDLPTHVPISPLLLSLFFPLFLSLSVHLLPFPVIASPPTHSLSFFSLSSSLLPSLCPLPEDPAFAPVVLLPPTTAPLQTLHMDVRGPAPVNGTDHERYFLLVVDDYTRYTTVFPLWRKANVNGVLIPWIRATRRQLRERFSRDFTVLRLHSNKGDEFSSDLLAEFSHQLNLWPRVSEPETSPTLRWTGKVGDASVFWVCGALSLVRDAKASKLSSRTLRCIFLGFPTDALPWQFYHPRSRSCSLSLLLWTMELRLLVLSLGVLRQRVRVLGGAATGGAATGGAGSGGAAIGGAATGGAATRGAGCWGAATGGADSRGPASPSCGGAVGDPAGGPGAGQPPQPDLLETLSLQAIGAWIVWRGSPGGGGYGPAGAGATRPGGTAGAGGTRGIGGGAGGPADAGGTRGAAGAGGAGATSPRGATGAGGAGLTSVGGTTGARGPGTAGASGAAGAGGAGGAGAACAGGGGAAGTALRRPFFYPQPQSSLPPPDSVLRQVLGLPSSTSLPLPLLCPPKDQTQPQLLPGSPLPAPAPPTEVTESLSEPETRASTPDRACRVARPRPPTVPGTHGMALRPSSVPQRVVLPEPPASSLPHVPDPESDLARTASPTVTRLLATVVTDPDLDSTAAFPLVTELVDFAARSHLDYVANLVTESESVCPPFVEGELAIGSDVLEDRQFELEFLAAALPRFASMLLCPEGDPDALDIPTPRLR